MQLSQLPGLDSFEHLLFVSSNQDGYVPFDSARIQICQEALSDQIRGAQYIQMSHNLLRNIKAKVIFRVDVDFFIEGHSLDSLIGRAAHIKMVDSVEFLRLLVLRYRNLIV
jgi:hypothetical protein